MASESNVMTFLPGEEPGDFALGTSQHPDDLGRMAAYKLRMAKLPTGADVAESFPWWRKVHETLIAREKLILLRPGWQATFENKSDHDVYVDEIRFRTEFAAVVPVDYQTRLMCKVGIPPRREIIADWTPVQVLHTEKDRMYAANLDQFTYEMPAPYVLQRANHFVMDLRFDASYVANAPLPDDWMIMVGLHGYGLQDGEPISLIKPVRGWPYGLAVPAGIAGQWQTISFDEEQGRAMRDAVITHITFGSALTTNVANVLEALEFRPHAPEGLDWHQGEFFAFRDISEQIGTYAGTDFYCVHRPIIPYVLYRGEGIMVELWNRSNNVATVDVILRGHQSGRRS